jgi:HD domain
LDLNATEIEIADTLVETDLERRCLDELRRASGEVEGPMERHCVRCFLLIELLARRRGIDFDREVALCASFIHDAGIYPELSAGGVYTDESGIVIERLFLDADADPGRAALARDACAQHHALRDQSAKGAEVELLRLADRIEVSGGVIRSGLSGREVGDVFERVSRKGFYTGIGALLVGVLRDRPTTLPRIFKTD